MRLRREYRWGKKEDGEEETVEGEEAEEENLKR